MKEDSLPDLDSLLESKEKEPEEKKEAPAEKDSASSQKISSKKSKGTKTPTSNEKPPIKDNQNLPGKEEITKDKNIEANKTDEENLPPLDSTIKEKPKPRPIINKDAITGNEIQPPPGDKSKSLPSVLIPTIKKKKIKPVKTNTAKPKASVKPETEILPKEVKVLQAVVESKNKIIFALQKEIEDLKKIRAENKAEVSQNYKLLVMTLKEELEQTKAALKDKENRIKELEQTITDLAKKAEVREKTMMGVLASIGYKERKIEQLRNENLKLKRELMAKDASIKSMLKVVEAQKSKNPSKALEEHITCMKKDLLKAHNHINELRKELNTRKTKHTRSAIDELKNKLSEMQTKIAQNEKLLHHKNALIIELKKKIDILKFNNNSLLNSLENIKKEKGEMLKTIAELSKRLKETEKNLRNREEVIKKLTRLQNLKKEAIFKKLVKDKAELTLEIEKLRKALEVKSKPIAKVSGFNSSTTISRAINNTPESTEIRSIINLAVQNGDSLERIKESLINSGYDPVLVEQNINMLKLNKV